MDLETLRELCMAIPGTTEDVKWDVDLCFLVGNKMYCVGGMGASFTAGFKATPEDFELLTARPGVVPNKYLARYHWLGIHDPHALSRAEWAHYVRKSFDMVLSKLSKKKQKEILGG